MQPARKALDLWPSELVDQFATDYVKVGSYHVGHLPWPTTNTAADGGRHPLRT
jgi:hypothetical protein